MSERHTTGHWHVGEAEFSREDWAELRAKTMTIIQRYSDVVAVIWDADDGGRPERMANAKRICDAIDQQDEAIKLLSDAREELRLIRLKDTGATYDPSLRTRLDWFLWSHGKLNEMPGAEG